MDYHDHEWGVPCHDDQALFERLTLEQCKQALAGPRFLINVKPLERLDNFDIQTVAKYDEAKVQLLPQTKELFAIN